MQYYITNFANIRNLTQNCIPISTAVWDPKWFTLHVDKNGVLNGIREESLSPKYLAPEACTCQKNCQYKSQVPSCPFLEAYAKYLDSIDFNYVLSECCRVSEDVRKITNFSGEPNIVLLVYEAVDNPCSERQSLINLFAKHGIQLNEFNKHKGV